MLGTDWVTEALAGLKEGNRDATFTRIVGKLHHSGLNADAILSLLLPHASRCSFADLDKVVKSVSRYSRDVAVQVDGEGKGEDVEEFLREGKQVEWIVNGLIARGCVGFVAGLPETLKTWILADLAVECARGGGKWLNLFPVAPSKVLFIDQERFKGETQRRFKNIINAKGITATSLRDSLFIRCGTTTRLDLEQSFRAFRQELLELKPDLVIVDSFATFHTRNDNDRQAIQPVLESIKQLRTEVGCTFLLIDHESKAVFQDKENAEEAPSAFRMVGSVGKAAAAELVLTVRKYDDCTSTVWNTKNSLAPTVPCFNVSIKDVSSGIIVEGSRG
jgi:KaiC/GvpD/RAD55 family RecA-like ATPase